MYHLIYRCHSLLFTELFDWKSPFVKGKKRSTEVLPAPGIHEQQDGTILSMCITGSGSRDSLISWLTFLQMRSKNLENLAVVFRINTPERGLKVVETEADRQQALKILENS